MLDKIVPFVCFTVFSVFTISELLSDVPTSLDKEIPEMKSSLAFSNTGKPVMHIQYCHSCGYHRAFTEYSQILQQQYPELIIEGSYHEPSGLNYILAKTLGIGKIFLIVMIVMSKSLFEALGRPQPRWWTWCLNNRVYACLTIFFLGNMFENMFMSTGAFEISLNGIPLWSKLESGRIPQPPELFSIIDSQFPHLKPLKFDYDMNTILPKHS